MKQNKIIVASYIVSILNLVASLIFIAKLPAIVPVHFDLHFVCDAIGSPWTAAPIAFLPLLICIGTKLLEKYGKKENAEISRVCTFAVDMYFIVLNWTMLFSMQKNLQIGDQLDGSLFSWPVLGSIGLLFIILGNYMPVIQPNKVFGLRLGWTLHNEICWRKTHRIGGKIMVVSGILYLLFVLLAILLHISSVYGFILMIFMVLIPISYIIFYAYQHKDDTSI